MKFIRGKLINGEAIARAIMVHTRRRVEKLRVQGTVPKLAVILVGKDKPSRIYVGRKEKAAKSLGIDFALHIFPATVPEKKLIAALRKIQADEKLSGIIIQLPLPERLYKREVINALRPELDVDYLTNENLGKLVSKSNPLEPPTAGATIEILRSLKASLTGKRVVVIGVGVLVGRPLALMLMNERATVTMCNSATKNLPALCKQADVIVSCVGQRNLVRGSMIKKGAIVIDAGFTFASGKVSGDVNVAEAIAVARAVTPTPGGVGPVTVAKLLQNVVLSAGRRS